MVSMVCNIYSERGLSMLSMWDADNQDAQVNTIDRFLEQQTVLRVVVALPFLVGHRQELHSTLWGFANEQYNEMISESERMLTAMAQDFMLKANQSESTDVKAGT
jgi:RNase H-fold protein (predicted Holliday junction resolvase)